MGKWLAVVAIGALIALGGGMSGLSEDYRLPVVLVSAIVMSIGLIGLVRSRRKSSTS